MKKPKVLVRIASYLRSRERGQLLVLSAIMLPVLLGFTALAVDLGWLYVSRTSEQRAADAAALAGALARLNNSTATADADSVAVAKDYATRNGYDASAINPGDGSNVVRAYWEPETGSAYTRALIGDESHNYIEVKIKKTQPTFFIRALAALGIDAPSSVDVSARAVAVTGKVSKDYALLVLNHTQCGSYTHNSSNDIVIIDGGAVVNSDATAGCGNPPCGACQSGGNLIQANADGSCPTEGACTLDHYSAGDWYTCSNCEASPPPTPISAPVADPLRCRTDLFGNSIDIWGSNKASVNGIPTADPGWKPTGTGPNSNVCVAPPIPCRNGLDASFNIVGAPDPSYCNVKTSQDSGGNPNTPKYNNISGAGTTTLHPGVYWGGIKLNSTSSTVTFLPGIYVLAGGAGSLGNQGGLSYNSGQICPVTTCTGVTFFNTTDPYAANAADRKCGALDLAGGGSLNLEAPKNAPYPVSTWPSPSADISPSRNGWKNMLFWQSTTCNPQPAFKYGGSGSGGSWQTSGVMYLPKAELNVNGAATFGAVQIIVDTFNFGGSRDVTLQYTPYANTDLPVVKLVE